MKGASAVFLVVLLISGASIPGCGESSDEGVRLHPPKAVTEALDARFDGADLRSWSEIALSDSTVQYEAEFYFNARYHWLRITDSAGVLGWEKRLRLQEIPQAVKSSAHAMCPGADIREAAEITMIEGGKARLHGYRVECELSKRQVSETSTETHTRTLYLTPGGTLSTDWRGGNKPSSSSCIRRPG